MSKVNGNLSEIDRKNKKYFIYVSVLAVLISLIYSYRLKWLGDDIFIGLRYVQNFLNGNGLVYNIGERVEGYTDFLWLMLVSLFTWLKVEPTLCVQALGILSSIGTLIIFTAISYKISHPRKLFIIPFVTLALALNYDYNVWATSGLEASFFCFLLSCAFYLFYFSVLTVRRKYLLTGLFLCLALLTRPDAILIVFSANVLLLVDLIRKKSGISEFVSSFSLFNLAIIIIYIPYFFWRYNYYGFLFPNTYYSKLGYESLFKYGFYYLWIYFIIHFVSFLVFILPPVVIYKSVLKSNPDTKPVSPISESKKLNSAVLAPLFFLFIYLFFFVARVGGDFMFARFIVPAIPFIYLIIFYSILKIVNEKKLNLVFGILLVLSFIETSVRFNYFEPYDEVNNPKITLNHGIADERDVYINYAPIENEIKLGKAIHRAFSGLDATLLIAGGQACFGYYSDFSYCQEMHGLTDTLIAHSEIKNRGRIGHEKVGTLEYFENKGLDVLIYRYLPVSDQFRIARLILPPYDIDISFVTYDNNLIKNLTERFETNFQYVNFQTYLDEYIKTDLNYKSSGELKEDYENFNLYYFKHNNDKIREDRFLRAMNKN